jgi:hypothetical protein|tara:strand:- start:48 stop:311 length:264 start_codon:yes stop_codon:yes gene_type:complete
MKVYGRSRMEITIDDLVQLAMEAGEIPWELVGIEDPLYSMEVIATNIYDIYRQLEGDTRSRELILLTTIINLTAENFVLNTQVGLMD